MTRKGYAAGTEMEGGYPSEADILDYLQEHGIELITDNNPNLIAEFIKFVWGLSNAHDWVSTLGVYCPTPTTFNVRAGKYLFAGEVKTYTPGDAVDPTDNDTTYIWLKPDNTIGSDIDGNGWPTTDHIKLAEIDVDSDGKVTAIRDLRGQTFLQYLPVLDEDDMASESETKVPTQQSVKAFVESHILCYENKVLCYENEVLIY